MEACKALGFVVLPGKGAHHPHAGEIFPGGAEDAVQAGLHLAVEGRGDGHEAEDDEKEHRNGQQKHRGHGAV